MVLLALQVELHCSGFNQKESSFLFILICNDELFLKQAFLGARGFPGTPGTGHGGGDNDESADSGLLVADPGFLVAGQDEDVQQELDTYVELGQRRGRGTQVSYYCMLLLPNTTNPN